MSLHEKLTQVKGKGEEKKITLRMQKGKVDLLEKLANHYDTNVSTLVREMIDESIKKLQLELIVLKPENGIEITEKYKDGDRNRIITYLPAVTELLAPDVGLTTYGPADFCSDTEAFNSFVVENSRLSVEYGMSKTSSCVDLTTNKVLNFTRSK